MIELERKLEITAKTKDPIVNKASQASFNSNGKIVLRNYNKFGDSKNEDEIYIFSEYETQAIIELFKRISSITQDKNLPF